MSNPVSGGFANSLFIDENNKIWGCGTNSFYAHGPQLINYFEIIDAPPNTSAIDCGLHCLFLSDETVWSCGTQNDFWQLGYDSDPAPVITKINNIPPIQSISASSDGNHSLFLDVDGMVWGCGDNRWGQLGLGASTLIADTPKYVDNLPPIKAIASGQKHSVFIDVEGTVWGCGNNADGELGIKAQRAAKPEKIENLPAIKYVFCGYQKSMFLSEDGSVWEATNSRDRLKQVENLRNIETIALGWQHSLFLDNEGSVWGCGVNGKGPLNDLRPQSTEGEIQRPEKLQLPTCCNIAAGAHHSLFVDSEYSLWTCGLNRSHQLGHADSSSKLTKIPNIPKVASHRKIPTKSARNVC